MLFEFLAILKIEQEDHKFKNFVIELEIDLGVFVPFIDETKNDFLHDTIGTLETRLFKTTINNEGYQSEIILDQDFNEFVTKTKNKKEYEYKGTRPIHVTFIL